MSCTARRSSYFKSPIYGKGTDETAVYGKGTDEIRGETQRYGLDSKPRGVYGVFSRNSQLLLVALHASGSKPEVI